MKRTSPKSRSNGRVVKALKKFTGAAKRAEKEDESLHKVVKSMKKKVEKDDDEDGKDDD